MTGFDRRLKDLLEKVRARAEQEGVQWRKADKDVFAFRAGSYVVTFAKERDPLIAIYDENGEELEAIDRADLDGRTSPDGQPLADIKNRIWRLARRGSGVSASALDRVLDWLDAGGERGGADEGAEPGVLAGPHGDIEEPELSPQAPQAGLPDSGTEAVESAPAGGDASAPVRSDVLQGADSDEDDEDGRPAPNGAGRLTRPPWAQ